MNLMELVQRIEIIYGGDLKEIGERDDVLCVLSVFSRRLIFAQWAHAKMPPMVRTGTTCYSTALICPYQG